MGEFNQKATEAAVIATLAARAADPKRIGGAGESTELWALDGKIEELDTPNDRVAIQVRGLQDIVDLIGSQWCGEFEPMDAPSVFCGRDCFRIVRHGTDRTRQVVMVLRRHPVWQKVVEGLGKGGLELSPKQLVRWLKLNLPPTSPDVLGLVQVLQEVTFTSTDERHSVQRHGEDSMGRSMHAKLDRSDQLPEAVTLNVRAFENEGMGHVEALRILVLPNPETATVTLALGVGEVNRIEDAARAAAMGSLRESLDDAVVVVAGTAANG